MKRLIIFILLCVPVVSFAKNKIKMVTYFPVPYVAYSRVSADQMDVGLTSACSMKLGCSESQSPLVTPKVNVQSGKLELNGGRGILGNSLTLGSGNTGTGRLSFSNVRMNDGNMESVNANDMTVSALNLFGRVFPSCKEANSASSGQMSWQSLKLKGASRSELYLACGQTGESSVCQPTDPRGATYTENNCPTGQTGTVTYTWNYDDCKYSIQNNCTSAAKKLCIVSQEWKEFSFNAQGSIMRGNCWGLVNFPNYQANIKCGDYSIPKAYTNCKLGEDCSKVTTDGWPEGYRAGYYIYDTLWGIPSRNLGNNSYISDKIGIYCVKMDLVGEDECLKGVNLNYPPTSENWYKSCEF